MAALFPSSFLKRDGTNQKEGKCSHEGQTFREIEREGAGKKHNVRGGNGKIYKILFPFCQEGEIIYI